MHAALLVDLGDTLLDNSGAMARAVLELQRRHRFAKDVCDKVLVTRWMASLRILWGKSITEEIPIQGQRRWSMRLIFDEDFLDDEADVLDTEFHVLY